MVCSCTTETTLYGRSLDLYGEWCEFEIVLMRQVIRLGDVVIDAGANIGTHTVAFANLVGSTVPFMRLSRRADIS